MGMPLSHRILFGNWRRFFFDDYKRTLRYRYIAESLNNIGYIYDCIGRYRDATRYYQKCLKTREELSDCQNKVYTLINIGYVYSVGNDYEQALCA
ncbi:MAG TPA: tetratricopeptide repeat protein [Candidatus Altiarchaeales archaeon]|nr:tetratricopeptide repeat protein [Candidatus Altiarchaeales archaeon]